MTAAAQVSADTSIRRHRLIFYFALTYAISWPLWLLSRLAGGTLGTVLLVVGGFGPPLAAAITIRYSGGSLTDWLHAIVRWRVPVRFYVYALGLPVLIMAVMNAVLAAPKVCCCASCCMRASPLPKIICCCPLTRG